MPPSVRIRPYKDFLTPALHRRFAMATACLSALCYLEAILIGEWNSFIWSWMPLGRAGIRTGLIFIPAFVIFLLRVAQLHIGVRTTSSPYQTLKTYLIRFETIQTAGWYLFSAWLFSEIYIWSASKEDDIYRIKISPRTDRPILNERPIYLTCYFIFLALLQTVCHLYYDYDRIDLPSLKFKLHDLPDKQAPPVLPPTLQIKERLPFLALTSLYRSLGMAVLSPVIYYLTLRNFVWGWMRSFSSIFWSLPSSGALPEFPPFHLVILRKSVTAGFLLVMLWEFANAVFSIYVAQEPLKNERPITYESKDPDGSLLTGLRGKKLQTRAFAFWELVSIAGRFEGRRKNMYKDIDRKGGTTWSQISAACLEVINGVDARITEYENPAPVVKPVVVEQETPKLPQITQPLKDGLKAPGDLFAAPPPPSSTGIAVIDSLGKFAKAHGQSPQSPKAREMLVKAESAVLSPKQKKEVEEGGVGVLFREPILRILQTNLGWPFRQEYRRRIASVVLGTPYGDVGIIVDAVDALTRLAVQSLKEDEYGNVQKDVKQIILTFTNTVAKLDMFKATLGFHWTDVERKRESPEVDILLVALKGGLQQLIESFGDYFEDLGLSQRETRLAREAAETRAMDETKAK